MLRIREQERRSGVISHAPIILSPSTIRKLFTAHCTSATVLWSRHLKILRFRDALVLLI